MSDSIINYVILKVSWFVSLRLYAGEQAKFKDLKNTKNKNKYCTKGKTKTETNSKYLLTMQWILTFL